MASKFSARCARRPFLKKNIVKQGENNWRIQFFTGYDYLWTRKPNKRIYTAITCNYIVESSKSAPKKVLVRNVVTVHAF